MSGFPYAGLQYTMFNPGEDGDDGDTGPDPLNPRGKQKAHKAQLVISLSIGLSAFLIFCFLRPRWSKFYAARKRRLRQGTHSSTTNSPERPTSSSGSSSSDRQLTPRKASLLPDLPNSLFGWIPIVYKISDKDVLASAGLDAYVFLGFFEMAVKFLLVAAVFGAAVLLPLHTYYGPNSGRRLPGHPGSEKPAPGNGNPKLFRRNVPEKEPVDDTTYLWAYVFFVWLFSLVCIKMLVWQTEKVVKVRQDYLGQHCTVTDRTIRISGIPVEDRTPEKIRAYVESFEVGQVEKVTICKKWAKLDELMDQRAEVLEKVEETLTTILKRRAKRGVSQSLPTIQPRPARREEHISLLSGTEYDESNVNADNMSNSWEEEGPTITVRSGLFMLKSKKVDAYQYYSNKLERLDASIQKARQQEYEPTASAFVTMTTPAAAQMAVQTLLDPIPHHYTAHLAPAPKDIVWKNTYMSKRERLLRAWTISICISFLTIIWLIPVSFLAAFLNLTSIRKFLPRLADLLEASPFISSLVQNFAPTLILTLLNVAIPYLYDFLSQYQGFISQSDIELSVISKNFFFTFFNLFFAFSVFGTASNMYSVIKDSLHDTTKIAFLLAGSLEEMAPFYINLIILQALAMFPVRLLDFGSLSLYPFLRLRAHTARQRYRLHRPPIFKYGFYLPQPLLVLILCIVYSVMPSGGLILIFGLIYFSIGYIVYKYQLLYAMDHTVHSTGKAWPLISYRIIVGLLLFQMAMAALLAARKAFYRALMVFPILAFTAWFMWYFRAVYAPLTEFVALKAIRSDGEDGGNDQGVYVRQWEEEEGSEVTGMPVRNRKDEEREEGTVFDHPGLKRALSSVDADGVRRDVEGRVGGQVRLE